MFVDANIFVNWLAAGRYLTLDEAISGFILYRVSRGEHAITSTLVKDEVLIWLSRYKASAMKAFLGYLRLVPNLEIFDPTLDDEENAVYLFGKYPLGISDLINLSLMQRVGVDGIYTTDKGFLETNMKVVFYELREDDDFRLFLRDLKKKGYVLRESRDNI